MAMFTLIRRLPQDPEIGLRRGQDDGRILVETLKRTNYELENMTREEVTADLLGSLDSIDTNPLPLLYHSGYLTIKDYDPDFGTYLLGFPNGEVERGFTKFLFRY